MNRFHPLTLIIILLIFLYLFSGCSAPKQEYIYTHPWAIQPEAEKEKPWPNPYQNQIDHYYELVEGKPRGQQVRHRGTYKHSDKFRWTFNVGTW